MARKAKIECEKKRARLVAKHRNRYEAIIKERDECFAALTKPGADFDALYDKIEVLQERLQTEIPGNGRRIRLRSRCQITGRARGVYSDFQMSRSMLRKYAMMGLVPGIRKASW